METNQKIEAWKYKAKIFLNEDKKVFIRDANEDYYFAEIILIDGDKITIKCFAPPVREGKTKSLYWVEIQRLEEYKEMEKDAAN